MLQGVDLVIQRLIEKTKGNSIIWNYVDEDPNLLSFVNKILLDPSYKKKISTFLVNPDYILNENASFSYKVNEGYFVLADIMGKSNDFPYIFLISIPRINSRGSQILNPKKEYQKELVRLQILVKSQYPNTEDFIDSFLAIPV
jgi:hypothetical protein